MKLFDSHCHIYDSSYKDDFQEMLSRAARAGVVAMMIPAADAYSAGIAVKIARQNDNIFASVGVHPHSVSKMNEGTIKKLKELAKSPEVKAWGEIGLDFNRMRSPQDVQEKWFIRQIEEADALELPIIFHERDTEGRFLELLKAQTGSKRRGVIHCFSGNRADLEAYLEMGYHIGVTGIVTQKERGRDIRELLPHIPKERLLIETDCPYLTPMPEKRNHRRNEPAFIPSVFKKVAEIYNCDYEELSEALWENTCTLYGIKANEIKELKRYNDNISQYMID